MHEKRGIWENSEVLAGVEPLSGYPTAPSKDAAKDCPVVVDSADPQATKQGLSGSCLL